MKMADVMKYLKAFLGFATKAAPVAAEVATLTGHGDVVGDISKAGAAANLANNATAGFEEVK